MDSNDFNKNLSGFNKINSIITKSNLGAMAQQIKNIIGKAPKISETANYLSIPRMKPLRLYNTKLDESILEEREKINEVLAEVHYHQEKSAYLYNRISNNPQSSRTIAFSIYISLFLIVSCISIPLLILPTDTYVTIEILPKILLQNLFSIKGLLVSISTILMYVIFITFLIKNNAMNYSKTTLQKLEELTKLENYSEYLKNYIENTSSNN